jgi:hypothetical protein
MTSTTNIETEAFVVDSPNAPFKLTPIVLDEMREDEFLIEMKYSGICHTVGGQLLPFSRGTDQATVNAAQIVLAYGSPESHSHWQAVGL